MLHALEALPLLAYYRRTPSLRARRGHAFLELAWTTGARQGGLRALDIRDIETGKRPYVEVHHRPETGAPLENKRRGERPVEIPRETADVLEE